MKTSRRNFFGIVAAIAAAAAVPEIADAKPKTVGPSLYEFTCNGGKHLYTPEEIQDRPGRIWGCGTTFRWWFGLPIYCPKCGYAYEATIKAYEDGRYKLIQ